ncbi:hypothetical protein [Pseudarthrobacter sp. 1C304]|uniref:hypothetical protein n=1 Tax=Pseudarthrobacter sp. 1C304 TaxID=3457438 RepID=UPI003FD0223C
MAVFDFTITGQLEVDEHVLGLTVANSVKTQPGGAGEIDVDAGFRFRLDSPEALGVILRQALVHEMETRFADVGWKAHKLDSAVERVPD